MKKINFKISYLCIIVIAPLIIVSSFFIINKINNNEFNNNSNIINSSSTYAIEDGEEAQTTFTYNDKSLISWYGKKPANEITVEDLYQLVSPANPSASFRIEIETITNDDLKNGVVKFKIFQTLKTYNNGIFVSQKEQVINAATGLGTSAIWQTPIGAVLQKKYTFSWANASVISIFVQTYDKPFTSLTKADVLENLVDSNSILPSENDIDITFADTVLLNNSRNLYGAGKITITFKNTQNSDWDNNSIPSGNTTELILRGLLNSSNTRSTMFLNLTSSNISNINLNTEGINIYSKFLLATQNAKLGDLFASQFQSIGQTNLIDLLTTNKYLQVTNNASPIASIRYMGLSTTDTNFQTTTGIDANIINQLKIEKIELSIDDKLGSMSIIYFYKTYDVITQKIIDATTLQTFVSNTFKVNPDAGKNLTFEWKNESVIQSGNGQAGIGTSYDILNNYMKNKDSDPYIKNLSNMFFNGTEDSYNQNRKIEIDYLGGGEIQNGNYVSKTANQSTITVKIWFDTWNGEIYELSGTKDYGLYEEKNFNLGQYQYSNVENIEWTSQTALFNEFPYLNTILPSNVSYEVSSSNITNPFITKDNFFKITGIIPDSSTDSVVSIFYPNDKEGTLSVKIYIQKLTDAVGSTRVYEQFYSGFKKDNESNAIQFGWIPQVEINNELLSKNIEDVTVQNIIDLYLSSIPLFQNSTLSASNVNINIDPNNSGSLIVRVTIPIFNQDQLNPQNQTFYTKISGFANSSYDNISDFKAPNNYTLIIAISASTFIVVLMGTILTILLIRSISFRKKNKKIKIGKKKGNK